MGEMSSCGRCERLIDNTERMSEGVIITCHQIQTVQSSYTGTYKNTCSQVRYVLRCGIFRETLC